MIALFVVAEVALITLRFYIAYFVLFAALATFVFAQRRGVMRMVVTYGLLLGLLFGALNIAVKRETLERQTTYMTLERLQTTREDQAMWGQSGFGQEYDVSTPTRSPERPAHGSRLPALRAVPVGGLGAASGPRGAGDAGVVRADAGLRPRARLRREAATAGRPAHPGLRGQPDRRLRPHAGQRGHRLPSADPDHDVLLHLHGGGHRRAPTPAGARGPRRPHRLQPGSGSRDGPARRSRRASGRRRC